MRTWVEEERNLRRTGEILQACLAVGDPPSELNKLPSKSRKPGFRGRGWAGGRTASGASKGPDCSDPRTKFSSPQATKYCTLEFALGVPPPSLGWTAVRPG